MISKNTIQSQKYRNTKRGHMTTLLSRARRRAKNNNIPFDLDVDYLMTIPSDVCPVFGLELAWCSNTGVRHENAPSLDKLIPELGYVKGNVNWISWRANRIKNDGNLEDHKKIVAWLEANMGDRGMADSALSRPPHLSAFTRA
jgi:hypothetical protein